MPEDHTRLRQVAWMELFPWLGLACAVRLAFTPRMILLAAIGLAATNAGWGLVGWIFSGSEDRSLVEARGMIEAFRLLQVDGLVKSRNRLPCSSVRDQCARSGQ